MISLRRTFSLACLLAICLQFMFSPQTIVQSQDQPHLTYLPLISRTETGLGKPVISSPANGAQLSTLTPTYIWNMGTQPAGSTGCLALDINPNPTDCYMTFMATYTGTWNRTMWFNLKPSTVYYWRVGVMPSGSNVVGIWSEERSFITGPAGGTLPAAPVLVSPASTSAVPSSQVTMVWNPISGAIEYEVELHNLSNGRWCGYTLADTRLTLYGASSSCFNSGGTSYEWSVSTRNAYGWGPSSETWTFVTPAAYSIQSNEIKSDHLPYYLNAAGNPLYLDQ